MVIEIYELYALILHSESYTSVDALNEAMRKFSITPKKGKQYRKYVNLITDSDGKVNLYLCLPDVKNAASDIKENAALYIHFAKSMLQIDHTHVHVAFDESLGNVIKLPKVVNDFMDKILKSAKSTTGLIGMRTHKFKSGFKSPVPGILCAIRVLRKNLPYYRKMNKDSTHLQLLKNACNTELGVGTPGIDEYAVNFVIQVLDVMTSEENLRFPASFYAVAKSENNVKTNEGILASLKYVSILPKVDKVIHVATRCFEYDEHGQPTKVEGVSDGEVMKHDLQYQAAVRLLLPLLNKRDDISYKDQVSNPERFLTEETQAFFKKNASHVDALNRAYAYSSAFNKKGKKKTRLVHVSNEINQAARSITNALPMQDSKGKTFENYMDLRYSLRKFLENLLKRRNSPKKKRDSSDARSVSRKKSRVIDPDSKSIAEDSGSIPEDSNLETGADMDTRR